MTPPPGTFTITNRDPRGPARCGVLETAHGPLPTPAFMPCASRAVIRALDTEDLAGTGLEIAICNAFHLSIAPGEGVVERAGGLHRFMDWGGKLATY